MSHKHLKWRNRLGTVELFYDVYCEAPVDYCVTISIVLASEPISGREIAVPEKCSARDPNRQAAFDSQIGGEQVLNNLLFIYIRFY